MQKRIIDDVKIDNKPTIRVWRYHVLWKLKNNNDKKRKWKDHPDNISLINCQTLEPSRQTTRSIIHVEKLQIKFCSNIDFINIVNNWNILLE